MPTMKIRCPLDLLRLIKTPRYKIKSRGEVRTDPDLVNEVLDQLPKKIWRKGGRFLDPFCGRGTFLIAIIERLKPYHSTKHILNMVYGVDIDPWCVYTTRKVVADYLGVPIDRVVNIVQDNALTRKYNMQFDAVVGNPPFLKGAWIDFLMKSIQLSSHHVVMISPDGTNNFSTRSDRLVQTLKENGIQSMDDCTGSFPNVQSGKIVIYQLDVTKQHDPQALIDNSIEGIIVRKITKPSAKKLQAILSGKRSKEHSSAARHQQPTPGTVKNLESVTKAGPVYAWVDVDNTTVIDAGDYWLANRYFGKDCDTTLIETTGKIGISPNILAIKRIPGWTIQQFKAIYLSDTYRFVLHVLRKGGFDTSPRHLAQLPVLKKSGAALYRHFNLTSDEIAHIQNVVK